MDRVVTVRFWRVDKVDPDAPPLSQCLRNIARLPLEERERDVGDDVSMRLDRMEEDGQFLCGEFVRRQVRNIPPNARRGQPMEPLRLGSGGSLGHRCAFRLHPGLSVLVMQSVQNGIRPASVTAYVRAVLEVGGYLANPIVPREMWEKLVASRPRRFKVKIAEPFNLAFVEGEGATMSRAMRDLRDTYGGVNISIEVSVDRKRTSSLDKQAVIQTVRSMLGMSGRSQAGIEALSVDADTGDGTEAIDFLTGQLTERERIDLPEGDVAGHYEARQRFIHRVVQKHWPAIREQMRDG